MAVIVVVITASLFAACLHLHSEESLHSISNRTPMLIPPESPSKIIVREFDEKRAV